MSDEVIEPSEILVEQRKGTVNEDTVRANPWLRFFARFFDYSLFVLFLWFLRVLMQGHLPLGRYEEFVPFEYFVWIPIEALLLSTWGTTPGKFLLKTKIRYGAKGKFDYLAALKRSAQVWFRGMGMGIPLICQLCMLVAYHRLKVFRKTSWDHEGHITIIHSPIGKWRLVVAVVIAIGGMLFYFHNKKEGIQQIKEPKQAHARVL